MSEYVTITREEMASYRTEIEKLRDALRAVLLFHSCTGWGGPEVERWYNLTHETEATTKVLCDTVRRALGEAR